MIAAVTNLSGHLTGVHRTWLDPEGFHTVAQGKAPIETPRRAMGDLLGHAVRFGVAGDVMVASEGIETILSLRSIPPTMPMAAALSAAHLAAILFSDFLRRLYIARDNDTAGDSAVAALIDRAKEAGIEALVLSPALSDFNEDPRRLGIDGLRAALRAQIAPRDARVSSNPSHGPRQDKRINAGAPPSSRRRRAALAVQSERTAPRAFLRGRLVRPAALAQQCRWPTIFGGRSGPPSHRGAK
jgi:hypothetical protein